MAGSAVIGALRVNLSADTAAWESGLRRAQGSAQNFASSLTKVFAGLGIAVGIEKVVEGVVHSLKAAVEQADQLGKTAQKVGLPVEELSKLKLAADLSDVSMETLSTSLGKLSKAMVEVARGGGDQAGLALRQLGVSVKSADGSLRSVGDVLADVAGKFEGAKDGASKTAAAMAIFGKGGKELIPLLNEGKDSLLEWGKAAERMGLVISKETSDQAQKFQDNIKLLNLAKQGLVNTVMAALLPALVRLSEQFVETAKDGSVMRNTAERIVDAIKGIVTFAYQAVIANDALGRAFNELSNAATEFATKGVFSDAAKHWQAMKDILAGMPASLEEAAAWVQRLFARITVGSQQAKREIGTDSGIQKAIEELAFKTRLVAGDFDRLAQGFPELAKGLVPLTQIKTTAEALSPALQKLNQRMLEFRGAQLTEDMLLPWQQYEKQLERINQLLAAGTINQQTAALATRKAAESTAQAWDLAASSITGSFAQAFTEFGKTNKEMALIAKAFGIVQATINAYTAASKALATYPPPLSYIAAAAAVAQGLAYVASIKSTSVPSFATGGMARVGGVGGVDSQLVSMRASPGELVKVETPEQQRSNVINLTINGDTVSKDRIRDMFRAINDGIADGYRINFAT